jgi:hypothetical protein
MSKKIAEAHESGSRAALHEIEAHSAAFSGDEARAATELRAAISAHRDAINLLVAALPDSMARDRSRNAV